MTTSTHRPKKPSKLPRKWLDQTSRSPTVIAATVAAVMVF
jgi:hypothetical protein